MSTAELENQLGHSFNDPGLLIRSLTHRSWAFENLAGKPDAAIREAENESLEFVGDSVLGLIVAERLFVKHPDLSEGDLTLMKHHLVSTETLSRVGAQLNLGRHIRMGRGEEKTGGREKPALLADTLEAVIAAVFFDAGYVKARSVVTKIFADEIKAATPEASIDFKTMLQELLQSRKLQAPVYSVIRKEGQPHSRTFFVEAKWDTGSSQGSGRSIKAAEMVAASSALDMLAADETDTPAASSPQAS